jgi:hypothetical protein
LRFKILVLSWPECPLKGADRFDWHSIRSRRGLWVASKGCTRSLIGMDHHLVLGFQLLLVAQLVGEPEIPEVILLQD